MKLKEKTNSLKTNLTNSINKIAYAWSALLVASNVYAGQAYASTLNGAPSKLDAKLKSGFIAIIKYVGGFVGFGILAFGIYNLVLAIRNEDSEGRNKALLNIVAGAVLTSIAAVLTVFGIK